MNTASFFSFLLLCLAKYLTHITYETGSEHSLSPYSHTKEIIFLAQHSLPLSSVIDKDVSVYDYFVEFIINKCFRNHNFSISLWEFSAIELILYLILLIITNDKSSWMIPIIGLASHSVRSWSDSNLFLGINSHPLSFLYLNLFILLVLEFASKKRFKLLSALLYSCLLYCKMEFIYLLPFIIALSKGSIPRDSKSEIPVGNSTSTPPFNLLILTLTITSILSVSVIAAYQLGSLGSAGYQVGGGSCRVFSEDNSNSHSNLSYRCLFHQFMYRYFPQSFNPNIGVYWYLEAEIIEDMFIYFELLRLFQPFILSIPLYIRIGQFMPAYGYAIMALIIQYHRKDTNLIDFLFAYYTFFRLNLMEFDDKKKIFNYIRFKGWLTLGLIIPIVLSPLMLILWVEFGTGNSNWLFFQGLGLYIFIALSIIELCRSIMIVCDDASDGIFIETQDKSKSI